MWFWFRERNKELKKNFGDYSIYIILEEITHLINKIRSQGIEESPWKQTWQEIEKERCIWEQNEKISQREGKWKEEIR